MEDIYITFIWKNLFLIMSSVVGVLITLIGWLWFKVDEKIDGNKEKIEEIEKILLTQRIEMEKSVSMCKEKTEEIKKYIQVLYKEYNK